MDKNFIYPSSSKINKGITLIALVVTIVVLLILAGVSISLLSGENGIIKQAVKSKDTSEYEQLKELVGTKITQKNMEFAESIEPYLRNLENEHQGIIVEKVADDTYYVTKGKATVTVYEDKDTKGTIADEKIELWDGTEKSPEFKEFNWYIYTPSQLKFLATYVNNGNTLTANQEELLTAAGYNPSDVTMTEDTVIYLMNDLDLGARASEGNWETTEIEEKLKWISIGDSSANQLLGTFEGNNNTIRGVYVNKDNYFGGIFGNSRTIKNLTIKNSYIKGYTCTGGIVGVLRKGTLENCHNINTTVILSDGIYNMVGGIAGAAESETIVKGCTNTGNIIGYGSNSNGQSSIGGIIGNLYVNAKIENCENGGTITATGALVGGLVGQVGTSSTVNNCNNKGKVTGDGMAVGGVIGSLGASAILNNCNNEATVKGYYVTGGVVGNLGTYSTVNNCNNTGEVEGNDERTGGVAGSANHSTTISNCSNTATVTGGDYCTGGIVGVMCQEEEVSNSKVEKCYNSGDVKGVYTTGGIVGELAGDIGQGTVIKCYNKGKVTGTDELGAIIGFQNTTTGNTLNNLYYLSSVGVGAIEGEDDTSKNIMSTTEDIKTYKEFLTWIESK